MLQWWLQKFRCVGAAAITLAKGPDATSALERGDDLVCHRFGAHGVL